MTRWGVRGLLSVSCLLAWCLALPGLAPAAGAAPMARADGSSGPRVAFPLAPGLSGSEHAALERSGAYGSHPLRLLVLGDSIAMTLGMGLSVDCPEAVRRVRDRRRHRGV